MTARDEKWESAFNHLHGLSKLTRTIKFLENEGERASRKSTTCSFKWR